jgi:hypothetical protein
MRDAYLSPISSVESIDSAMSLAHLDLIGLSQAYVKGMDLAHYSDQEVEKYQKIEWNDLIARLPTANNFDDTLEEALNGDTIEEHEDSFSVTFFKLYDKLYIQPFIWKEHATSTRLKRLFEEGVAKVSRCGKHDRQYIMFNNMVVLSNRLSKMPFLLYLYDMSHIPHFINDRETRKEWILKRKEFSFETND